VPVCRPTRQQPGALSTSDQRPESDRVDPMHRKCFRRSAHQDDDRIRLPGTQVRSGDLPTRPLSFSRFTRASPTHDGFGLTRSVERDIVVVGRHCYNTILLCSIASGRKDHWTGKRVVTGNRAGVQASLWWSRQPMQRPPLARTGGLAGARHRKPASRARRWRAPSSWPTSTRTHQYVAEYAPHGSTAEASRASLMHRRDSPAGQTLSRVSANRGLARRDGISSAGARAV